MGKVQETGCKFFKSGFCGDKTSDLRPGENARVVEKIAAHRVDMGAKLGILLVGFFWEIGIRDVGLLGEGSRHLE